MVMDATPSPQNVGREFVRQYYTLLNKAPNHLHRFYNNHSSFIHGGLDAHNREATVVIGQKNIHNKIQQLNFRDCHAKISQVDAQATLGNGVVVQVTGELSNDGQPMRRFTQTFVLAAQSPKNYYVHNDIFRYQDLYIEEDVEIGETHSENNDEQHDINSGIESTKILLNNNSQSTPGVVAAVVSAPNSINPAEPQQTPLVATANAGIAGATAPQQIYYTVPLPQAVVTPFNAAAVAPVASAPVPQVAASVPGQLIATPPQQIPAQVNGVHEELLQTIQQSAAAQIAPAVPAAAVLTSAVVPQAAVNTQVLVSQQPPPALPTGASIVATSVPLSSQVASPVPTQGPINSTILINTSTPPTIPSQQQTLHNNVIEDKKPEKRDISPSESDMNKKEEINLSEPVEKYESKANPHQNEVKTYANLFKSGSFSNSGFVPLPQPAHQINSQVYSKSTETTRIENNPTIQSSGALPQRTSASRQNKDYSDRRTSNANSFGDSHQLFLGNVPHCATEDDLKALFSQFGTVVELRIHSKPGTKMPGQRNIQNYGFITYEKLEDVQNCLDNTPLYFPAENGQKLNVEEKKTRPRNDIPNRQQNNMSNSGSLGSSQRTPGSGNPGQGNRSHSNTGSLMRTANSGQRNSGGGGNSSSGGFNRNDNRGPPQSRIGSNTNQNSSSGTGGGGGSYGRR